MTKSKDLLNVVVYSYS